ncbi:MAG: TetR-like C-terminal domain-containing protein, partial [Chloroflexota bacterium]
LAEAIMGDMFKVFAPMEVEAKLPHNMMAYAVAGAQIGVIKWWLDNGMEQSPKEVAFMLEQLLKKGLIWGLGADEKS